MKKLYSLLLYIMLSVVLFAQDGPSIPIVHFDNTSKYAPGSGVSIVINPTGVFEIDNQFTLELLNSSGSVVSTLSTVDEFYVPVLNGTLPSNLSPGKYKLRIKSSKPNNVEITSEEFEVINAAKESIPCYVNEISTQFAGYVNCIETCSYSTNNIRLFGKLDVKPEQTTTSLDDKDLFIENIDENKYTYRFDLYKSNGESIQLTDYRIPNNLPKGHYVIVLSATNKQTHATTTTANVFLWNSSNLSIGNKSSETVCAGGVVLFKIELTDDVLKGNYPASLYEISFGDGTPKEIYTYAQLYDIAGEIGHIFNKASCHTTDGKFEIKIRMKNKGNFLLSTGYLNDCYTFEYYGEEKSTKVITAIPPTAKFTLNNIQCHDKDIETENISITGEYSGAGGECSKNIKFTWSVKKPNDADFREINRNYHKDWIIDEGRNLKIPIRDIDKTGCWQIKLKAKNEGGSCDASTEDVHTIKIEPTLTPNFTLDKSRVCVNEPVTTQNSTSYNSGCESPSWTWSTSSDSYSKIEQVNGYNTLIRFTQKETYTVTLSSTNTCGTKEITQNIEVTEGATAKLPKEYSVCQLPPASTTLDFSAGEIKPEYSTGATAPTSFNWNISGGNYSFEGGTSAESKYPKIKFTEYKDYTIKLAVNGECGNSSTQMTFSLRQMPTVETSALWNQTVCSGESTQAINLKDKNGLTDVKFSWTVNESPQLTPKKAKSSGISIPSETFTNSGTTCGNITYSITPSRNGCEGRQENFSINVNPKPSVQDKTRDVCSGEEFVLQFSSSDKIPSGTTYSWAKPSADPSKISGLEGGSNQSSVKINLTNLTNTTQSVTYNITATSPDNCSSSPGISCRSSFQLKVNLLTKPEINNFTKEICSGEVLAIKPANGTDGIVPEGTKYSWEAPTVDPSKIDNVKSGNNQPAIELQPLNKTTETQTVTYTITPSAGSCSGNPFTVTITIKPNVYIGNQEITICSGNDIPDVEWSGESIIPAGVVFSWAAPSVNGITGTTAGTNLPKFSQGVITNHTNEEKTVVYKIEPTGTQNCNAQPFDITVTVNPVPNINDIQHAVCSGTEFSVSPENGTDGIVPVSTKYTWSTPTLDTGLSGGSASQGEQSTIKDQLTNSTTDVLYATYNVTSKAGDCDGNTFQAKIEVKPVSKIETIEVTVCNNEEFEIDPKQYSGNIVPDGTVYEWQSPSASTYISGGSNGTGTTIKGKLSNSSATAQKATYIIVPTSDNCTGESFTVVVTVLPSLKMAMDNVDNVCGEYTFNSSNLLHITGDESAIESVQWTITPDNGGYTYVSGDATSLRPVIKFSQWGTYNVSISATTHCETVSASATVKIDEPVDLDITVPDPLCANITDEQGQNPYTLTATPTGGEWSIEQHPEWLDGNKFYPNEPGAYNLTYKVKSHSCTASGNLVITVRDYPSIDVGQNVSSCLNDKTPIKLEGTPDGGEWSGTGVTKETDGFYYFTPPAAVGSTTLTYTITDEHGCKNRGSKNGVVLPLPDPGFTALNFCLPDPIEFQTNASATSNTFLFDYGDGTTGTDTKHTYATMGDYNVTLTVTDNNQCSSSQSKTIKLLDANFNLDITADHTEFCVIGDVKMTNKTASDNDLTYTWSVDKSSGWNFAPGSNPDSESPTLTFTQEGKYTISVAVKNICRTKNLDFDITTHDKMYYSLSGVNNVCGEYLFVANEHLQITGDQATISNVKWSITPNDGDYTYTEGDETTLTPQIKFNKWGHYTVTAEITAFCNTETVSANIDIDEPIDIEITVPDPLCANIADEQGQNPYTLTATPAGGEWSTTIHPEWLVNGVFYPNSPGSYSFTYSVRNNSCTAEKQLDITVRSYPQISVGADVSACEKDQTPILLQGEPDGGVWSGAHVTLENDGKYYFNPPLTAGTTPITYTITDGNGCKNRASKNGIVMPLPKTGFSPTYHCLPEPVVFEPEASGANKYRLDYGDGTSGTDLSHTYDNIGVYNVKLVISASNGCADSLTQAITVEKVPDQKITLSEHSGCSPFTPDINGTYTYIDADNTKFTWDFGIYGTDNKLTPDPVTFEAVEFDKEYPVSLTIRNLCGSHTVNDKVTVLASPTAGFDVSSKYGCSPVDVEMKNTSKGSPYGLKYVWDFGDGSQPTTEPFPTHQFTTDIDHDATYKVTLTATNDCGSNSAYQDIYVTPSIIKPQIVAPSQTACVGDEVCIIDRTIKLRDHHEVVIYKWDFGNGKTSDRAEDNCTTYNDVGPYKVKLTISTSCGSTESDELMISLYSKPDFDISVADITCDGDALTPDITLRSDATVEWDFGDGTHSSITNPSHIYASDGQYEVTATATANNFGKCKSSKKSQATIVPLPNPIITPSEINGCSPLTYTPEFSVKYYTMIDYLGTGTSQAAESYTYTNHTDEPATYIPKFYFEDKYGCKSEAEGRVTVYPEPTAMFSIGRVEHERPEVVTFVNESELADDCVWTLPYTGIVNSCDNAVERFMNNTPAQISLKVSNHYGCTDTYEQTYQPLMKGLFFPNTFSPNGNTEAVRTFNGIGIGIKEYELKIFDLYGNLVFITNSLDADGSPNEGWDGRNNKGELMPQDVYTWQAKAVFSDDTTYPNGNSRHIKDQTTEKRGSVLLLLK
ncbi:MAG: PKD domain-containing protein [Bacteroidales bacterium]|nr:PKD domain-containing protein [Bacteroidales bacterium]MDY6427635.1 PKD domain-containing protein [Bacteroidales bacterium]